MTTNPCDMSWITLGNFPLYVMDRMAEKGARDDIEEVMHKDANSVVGDSVASKGQTDEAKMADRLHVSAPVSKPAGSAAMPAGQRLSVIWLREARKT